MTSLVKCPHCGKVFGITVDDYKDNPPGQILPLCVLRARVWCFRGKTMAGAETVKEFQIITNNYSAECQSAAEAIVSAATKSGTNSFHGSLFQLLRNDNLDAFRWEDKRISDTTPEKPEFKRNQIQFGLEFTF